MSKEEDKLKRIKYLKRCCLLCENYRFDGVCASGCSTKPIKIRDGVCYGAKCGEAFTPHPIYSNAVALNINSEMESEDEA